jgi:hypothetical protein
MHGIQSALSGEITLPQSCFKVKNRAKNVVFPELLRIAAIKLLFINRTIKNTHKFIVKTEMK